MDIKKEDINKLKKHLDLIDKIYDEKIEYLEEADTKEDAFKEGINSAIQALNIHLVIECLEQVNTTLERHGKIDADTDLHNKIKNTL